MRQILGLVLILLLCTQSLYAQQIVTGKIVDAKTLEPLAAAHIIIKGTYKGTIANADGEFTLRVDSLPATIVLDHLGRHDPERRW